MTREDNDKAWLVFTNQTDLKILRILKPGFRHCFVVLKKSGQWLTIDPMAHFTEVVMQERHIMSYLSRPDYEVIEVPMISPAKKPAPPMFFTCVEACKRLLGIQKITVLTPWQLYCHVQEMNT